MQNISVIQFIQHVKRSLRSNLLKGKLSMSLCHLSAPPLFLFNTHSTKRYGGLNPEQDATTLTKLIPSPNWCSSPKSHPTLAEVGNPGVSHSVSNAAAFSNSASNLKNENPPGIYLPKSSNTMFNHSECEIPQVSWFSSFNAAQLR